MKPVFRLEPFQGQQMSLGQVVDVYVIANARAVGGWIIGAETLDMGPLSHRCLEDESNQVRFRIVILSNRPIAASAGRVEIAERGKAPPITGRIIAYSTVSGQLPVAVG